MLEELILPLPSFRAYEQAMPMNNDLEAFLVDVYTEVVCFYARTIHFFHSHRNGETLPLFILDINRSAASCQR